MEVTFEIDKYVDDKSYKKYWKQCVANACKESGVKIDLLRLFDAIAQRGVEVKPKKPKRFIPLKDVYSHIDIMCATIDKAAKKFDELHPE